MPRWVCVVLGYTAAALIVPVLLVVASALVGGVISVLAWVLGQSASDVWAGIVLLLLGFVSLGVAWDYGPDLVEECRRYWEGR